MFASCTGCKSASYLEQPASQMGGRIVETERPFTG
jgi:hypothetical protein